MIWNAITPFYKKSSTTGLAHTRRPIMTTWRMTLTTRCYILTQ